MLIQSKFLHHTFASCQTPGGCGRRLPIKMQKYMNSNQITEELALRILGGIRELTEEVKNLNVINILTKNVLTFEEVMMLTGLSRSHLYMLTSKKAIPHAKRGKMLYFDRAEIEAWLMENRVQTDEEAARAAVAYIASTKK